MKSIKEKAEEYQETALKDKWAILRGDVRNAYKAGANYVLEQVEKLIYQKHVEGNLPLFDLTKLIDKLKEK